MVFFFVSSGRVMFQFDFMKWVVFGFLDFFGGQLVVCNGVKIMYVWCYVVVCNVLDFQFVYIYEISDLFKVDGCIVDQLNGGGFCYNWFVRYWLFFEYKFFLCFCEGWIDFLV